MLGVCSEYDETHNRLQTAQPTSGGAVTALTNCCANCVETSRPQQWGPDLPCFGQAAMRTRWMAGTALIKANDVETNQGPTTTHTGLDLRYQP